MTDFNGFIDEGKGRSQVDDGRGSADLQAMSETECQEKLQTRSVPLRHHLPPGPGYHFPLGAAWKLG